jgi:signal transduction histidine kinase
LVGALRDLVMRLKKPTGPALDIAVSGMARLGLSAGASDHLYRIAQEALTNALKHAHANSIKVTLEIEQERVRLEICDDGGGVKDADQHAPGLGLRTMQYRASIIGARLKITPFRPNGTSVICECPQGAD